MPPKQKGSKGQGGGGKSGGKGGGKEKGKGSTGGGKGGKGGKGKGKNSTTGSGTPEDDILEQPDQNCYNCGSEYPTLGEFCINCGKPRKPLNCWNCNERYLKNSHYCVNCGETKEVPTGAIGQQGAANPKSDELGVVAFAQGAPGAPGNQAFEQLEVEEIDDGHGDDWIWDDELIKQLEEERDAALPDGVLVPTYPEMPAEEAVRQVGSALDARYGQLLWGLRNRLRDYWSRCEWVSHKKELWDLEINELKQDIASWHQRLFDYRNKKKEPTGPGGVHMRNVRRNGNAVVKIGAGGTDVDYDKLDLTLRKLDYRSAYESDRNWVSRIYNFILPLQKDVRYIKSHFGDVVGAIFELNAVLMLLTFFAAACLLPIIIMNTAKHWKDLSNKDLQISGALLFPISRSFFLGGYHDLAPSALSSQSEAWAPVLHLTVSGVESAPTLLLGNCSYEQPWQCSTVAEKSTSLANESWELVREQFNLMYGRCPIVRYRKNCQTIGIFVGQTQRFNSTSNPTPYDVLAGNWSQIDSVFQPLDWAIYDTISELIAAQSPWRQEELCTQDGRGFPGKKKGDKPCYKSNSLHSFSAPFSLHAEHYTKAGSGDDIFGGKGARLEVFSGSRCLVSNSSNTDIKLLWSGVQTTAAKEFTSDRNISFMLCFLGGMIANALLAVVVTLKRWEESESAYSLDVLKDQISPARWRLFTLGIWNFRLEDEKDRALWQLEIANSLRGEYEQAEEHDKVKHRSGFENTLILLKRILSNILNIAFIVVAGLIVYVVYDLEPPDELGILKAYFPPAVIATISAIMPALTKALVSLESRDVAGRARWSIIRLFLGRLVLFHVYLGLLLEVINGKTLNLRSLFAFLFFWRTSDEESFMVIDPNCREHALREGMGFFCKEDQAATDLGVLVTTDVASAFVKPFIKIGLQILRQLGLKIRGRLDKTKGFQWKPEFAVADYAVEIITLFLECQLLIFVWPHFALLLPLVMYASFKWLKFAAIYLSTRSFASDVEEMNVTLSRLLYPTNLYVLLIFLLVPVFTINFEPGCTPFDGWQAPILMLNGLDFSFKRELIDVIVWVRDKLPATLTVVILLGIFFCSLSSVLRTTTLNDEVDRLTRQADTLEQTMNLLSSASAVVRTPGKKTT
eukprot:TRINITY_DN11583_c0_g1_i2.p1 TRINITY_DN11583_c0_g1~~TRINITY_DN11583_c0_g1_i2.p1  ORF type:complete len:1136 (+),score=181.59 TRINITY_DN11583_c0_g1_i2:134-3541(+)